MRKAIFIERTKKGLPALWESGGGYSNTGEATIIAGKNGEAKQPIYIRRRGQLACCRHALVILEVGDYIIVAFHHREDFEIEIYRVLDFDEVKEEMYAVMEHINCRYNMEHINCFGMGEWDAELPASLEAAVQAAMEKATCYHCREPHFIIS